MLIYLHMVNRTFWLNKIDKLWKSRSILWLSGVRRVGKTCLCQSLPNIEYFDCELPSVRRQLEDPESFLDSLAGKKLILDEIHRLQNPAQLLKIAADHYPKVKIIATGSSTLGASTKFKDTLAGRKHELWLTPMISQDLKDFQQTDLIHRLHHGGLPPLMQPSKINEKDYQEWMDAYWAKDIQELFRLERRYSFQKFAELLFTQSSGLFEATRFTAPCEVSRGTISNYLAILEATFVVHVIRPFTQHRAAEIVSAPKVYGFDTGFISVFNGWQTLRSTDLGVLWKHFVLNEMQAQLQTRNIRYWRDKRKHEIDFVLVKPRDNIIAIECKWSVDSFDPVNLLSFRHQYPRGQNYVVAKNISRSFEKKHNGITFHFVGLETLIRELL
ncbi:ATP-binding protein [bacterium]|nr:ATP-binding protein [bacterium]